ncbi:MAG: hypothetical protein ACK541_11230 [Burkholderiales bacterium]
MAGLTSPVIAGLTPCVIAGLTRNLFQQTIPAMTGEAGLQCWRLCE